MDSLSLSGASATQRLIIRDSGNGGISVIGQDNNANRFHLRWADLLDNNRGGFEIGTSDNSLIRDSTVSGSAECGWCAGLATARFDVGIAFVDVDASNNGCGAGNGHHDGFFAINEQDVWYIRARAFDNCQRGFDTGSGGNTGQTLNYKFRDIQAWDNGTNAGQGNRAGWEGSGEADDSIINWNYVVGYRGYRNPSYGFGGYAGIHMECWHCTLMRNGHGDGSDLWWDRETRDMRIYNSVTLRRSIDTWTHGVGGSLDFPPVSDHSLFVWQTADTNSFASFKFTTGCTVFSTANPLPTFAAGNRPCWSGANDTYTGTHPFTSIGGACDSSPFTYENCNFAPAAGSAAVDTGRTLMVANGGGTNQTQVTVSANGGSSDPRNYFIGPASFLGASEYADTIRIGSNCTDRTITAMTATTISFTPACSWSNGDGIHIASKWLGSAPDRGAFEFSQAMETTSGGARMRLRVRGQEEED